MSNCVNCGSESEFKYCPNCGQRSSVPRLGIKTILQDLQDKLLGLDSKFGRTVLDLCYKPGSVARSYIDGNRIRYVGPAGYFFLMVTILVLIITGLEIDMITYTQGASGLFQPDELTDAEIARQRDIQGWVFRNFKFATFAFIPFYVLGSRLLFFKSRYNLLEHSVFIFYSQAHSQLLNFLSLIVFKLTGLSFTFGVTLVSILYMGYFALDFFSINNRFVRILKGILIFPLGLIFLMVFIMIAAVFAALFFIR